MAAPPAFAEVAVATDAPFRQAFSYRVPAGMHPAPGDAVLVPFGRQLLPGVVLRLAGHANWEGAVRDIALAGESLLLEQQVALALWLAEEYFAPVSACVSLMMPPEWLRRVSEMVEWLGSPVPDSLSTAETKLVARLQAAGKVTMAAVRRSFGGPADAAISRMEAGGLVRRVLALPPPTPAPADARAPSTPPSLSPAQAAAVADVSDAIHCRRPETFLLHGVTGSGKTEVYLAAVAAAHQSGRRSMVLVPEIVLTPQTVQRFSARFPGSVVVAHSGITPAQRYHQWHEARAGRATVVVGARSALFLPQPDLGLIIIDEEHEWSYKQQDPAPRYHARDVARRLAEITGAVVVLGSATPDVVTFWRAQQGQYRLLSLPDRVGGATPTGNVADGHPLEVEHGTLISPSSAVSADEQSACEPPILTSSGGRPTLPDVHIVDLAAELRAGNRSMFSRALDTALRRTLAAGEQSILFLNRRGSASFVLCRDCGHVPRCQGCLVPFAFHAGVDRLRCHHCNRQRRVPQTCPQCGSKRIRFFGFGTERVAEEVSRLFPAARVVRWDRDAARTSAQHEALLETFATGEANVLVGTQMVSKGLDFPGVTLVGAICADVAINLPHFRSGERAFQLLTQVAGRAGRGERPGQVIIQTYNPHHYAIVAAARHDYTAMYNAELAARRRAGYPPFGRLARLMFVHTNPRTAEDEARRLAADLRTVRQERGLPATDIIGPALAFHERLKGRWRWHIVIRSADPGELLRATELPRGWVVDMDPATLI